jgi:hypothetical protein
MSICDATKTSMSKLTKRRNLKYLAVKGHPQRQNIHKKNGYAESMPITM